MSKTTSVHGLDISEDWGETATTFAIHSRVSVWRRLWFVVSCIPRYLISGSVEVP